MSSGDLEFAIAGLAADLSRSLIALDFDGTLARIVEAAEDARPERGAIPALQAIANRGAKVAIVTGREALVVVDLGGFDAVSGLVVAGIYGAELWTIDSLTIAPEPPWFDSVVAEVRSLASGRRLRVEDKRIAVAVHARGLPDADRALFDVRAGLRAVGEKYELELHDGRSVLELRIPGFDKGSALAALVAMAHPRSILFAGDDLGDLPAFAAVREFRAKGLSAWSIAVRSDESPEVGRAADFVVEDQNALISMLDVIGRG